MSNLTDDYIIFIDNAQLLRKQQFNNVIGMVSGSYVCMAFPPFPMDIGGGGLVHSKTPVQFINVFRFEQRR